MMVRWKPVVWGAAGALAVLLTAIAILWLVVTYQRAEHGEEAYDYIRQVIQQQQKAQPGK